MENTINKQLLPVKAHNFFFMAAMGPIIPQIFVFGKHLNIPPDTMGYIVSVLPLIYILGKVGVNWLPDLFFGSFRKFILVLLTITTIFCFAGFYFIPRFTHSIDKKTTLYLDVLRDEVPDCGLEIYNYTRELMCTQLRKMMCTDKFRNGYIFNVLEVSNHTIIKTEPETISALAHNRQFHICHDSSIALRRDGTIFTCETYHPSVNDCDESGDFWRYVLLLSVGTIGFNILKSISDRMYFDVLGKAQEIKPGTERFWGSIGFGVTSLLGGIAVHFWTAEKVKIFTPALVVMLIFSGFHLNSISMLKLPRLSSNFLFSDVWKVLRKWQVVIYFVFATVVGILDSFITYFMFWHLEEIAATTWYVGSTKLIEGCVIAVGCLCGEVPIFLYGEKLIKKIGDIHCLSVCFYMYAIRLLFIALIQNPWWLVATEVVMHGCTHALAYTSIKAYASAIAPLRTTTTVQDLGAGMMDRLGFIIGPLIGGNVYKLLGGARSFLVFAGIGIAASASHSVLRPASSERSDIPKPRYIMGTTEQIESDEKLESESSRPVFETLKVV